MKRPTKSLPPDKVSEILREIATVRLAKKVYFHVMGEPLIHPNIIKFCDVATALGLSVHLTTNASLLSEDMIEAIIDTQLKVVDISLRNTDDMLLQTAAKDRPIDFDRYFQMICLLIQRSYEREATTQICIRLFVPHFSERLMGGAYNQAKLYSTSPVVEKLTQEGNQICGQSTKELFGKSPPQEVDYDKLWQKIIPITPNCFLILNHIQRWWERESRAACTKYPARLGYCDGFRNQFAILSDGSITACCLDYDGGTAVGNVFESNLSEILSSKTVTNFSRYFNSLRCPTTTCTECLGGATHLERASREMFSIARRLSHLVKK